MSTHPVATQSPSVEKPVNLPEPQSLPPERLRAWSWHRQGLDGSLAGCTAEQVLARAGWARSVGGANPYLTLFARAGIRRAQVDADVLAHRILELPVARGCTYVLGRDDFAWALQLGRDAAASAWTAARSRCWKSRCCTLSPKRTGPWIRGSSRTNSAIQCATWGRKAR